MKASWKLSTAIVAVTVLTAGAAPAFAQDGASDDGSIAEIVVTATRREESANKVSLAIQALGGDTLAKLNVTNFEKMVEYLPNVRTASRGPGISSIYIRGLSTDTAGAQILGVAGVQPNVALYLNDAPSSTPGRNLDVYSADLQRVEVLAGPQGTLFGASAMGGAIRYITNKPDLSEFKAGFSASASTTKGGSESYSAQGFVNIPIVKDTFGIRLVVFNDNQGGYIDNVPGTYRMPFNSGSPGKIPTGNPLLVAQAIQSCVGVVNCVGTATGTSGGYIAPNRQSISNSAFVEDNYNDASYSGGRLEATWKINDDWTLGAMHMRQKLTTDGVFDYDPSVGDLKVQKYSPNTLKDTFDMTTLTLNGRLGMLDVIYAGSYLNRRAIQNADYATYANIGLYLPFYNCDRGVYYSGYASSASQGNTCYSPANSYMVDNKNKRWTHELRLTTPADKRIRATFGAFYDVNKIEDDTEWRYTLPAAGFIYSLTPTPITNVLGLGPRPVGTGFVNVIERRDRQYAFYGEASFDLIPEKLILTGGLRYYNSQVSMRGGSNSSFFTAARGIYNPATGTYTAAAVPPTNFNTSSNLSVNLAGINPTTYSGVIFKGNLTYKIAPDQLVYATYSEGYRPGGFNRKGCNSTSGSGGLSAAQCALNRAYAPDNVKNYEIGAKLALFDRTMQLNLAAYKIDWTGIQMAAFDQNISNQTFVVNLANARIYGFEGDLNWRPTRELTVGAGFSYNDSKLTGYVPALQILGQRILVPLGSPLALSPKFQGNMRVRYEWETSSGLRPYVQAGMHYVGKTITSNIDNTNIIYNGCRSPYNACGNPTAIINGVTVRSGDVIGPIRGSFNQPSFTTFSAAIGVSKDQWRVEVFGENIGDARPQQFTSANDGDTRVTTSRPQTFGLRVSYSM